MNSTINTRLAKIEAHYTEPDNRPEAIFIGVLDGRKGTPKTTIGGWNYLSANHKVWRASGETDQQLEQRAIEEVRKMIRPEETPIFFQLTEEDKP